MVLFLMNTFVKSRIVQPDNTTIHSDAPPCFFIFVPPAIREVTAQRAVPANNYFPLPLPQNALLSSVRCLTFNCPRIECHPI